MTKKLLKVVFALVTISLASCSKDSITGFGSIKEETRNISYFTGIEVKGEATVYVSQGTTHSVRLRAYENILPHIQTSVGSDKVLSVGPQSGVNIKNSNLEVYVTLPSLTEIHLSGKVKGFVQAASGNHIRIHLEGLTELQWESASQFSTVSLIASGDSRIEALLLRTDTLNVSMTGDCTVKISCDKHIKGELSGKTHLSYRGNPTIDVSTTGSSRITKL